MGRNGNGWNRVLVILACVVMELSIGGGASGSVAVVPA